MLHSEASTNLYAMQYFIYFCIIPSLNKACMFKTVPSEMLKFITRRQAQVLCATLQQLISDYAIMIIIIMCSKKGPLYSHCLVAVLEGNEMCHFEICHSSTSYISYTGE